VNLQDARCNNKDTLITLSRNFEMYVASYNWCPVCKIGHWFVFLHTALQGQELFNPVVSREVISSY